MSNAFSAVQGHFAGALLDAGRPVPRAVTSHTARKPDKRFAVYRNNVIAGLSEALRTQFPATESIVGTEFFSAMARVYIATEPPRSPVLISYGECFPAFIETFPPAAELPYLAESRGSKSRARRPITPPTPCRSRPRPDRRSICMRCPACA